MRGEPNLGPVLAGSSVRVGHGDVEGVPVYRDVGLGVAHGDSAAITYSGAVADREPWA
jgi:hypothetical protein